MYQIGKITNMKPPFYSKKSELVEKICGYILLTFLLTYLLDRLIIYWLG